MKLEGSRYERLEVLEYVGRSRYRCRCDCGNEKIIIGADIVRGKTKSCGCLNKERHLNIIGQKFNRLTVIEKVGKTDEKRYLFKCKCDCGNEKILEGRDVKGGKIKSCGCGMVLGVKKANTTHGMTNTRIYNIHHSMLQRCTNPNDTSYEDYGGRGIKVCEDWLDDFMSFYNWAMENGYEKHLTIDRINVNGDYEPENCRWATNKQQQNNRRNTPFYTYDGKTKSLSDWCYDLDLKYDSIWKRLNKYNFEFEKAITHNIEKVKINKII